VTRRASFAAAAPYPLSPQGQPQGGFRRSGFGRELSEETLLEYSAPKAVNIGLDPARPPFWG
jgi:acyl-CoA reductase-like NAD-dependent aldehyde dehydrogenase